MALTFWWPLALAALLAPWQAGRGDAQVVRAGPVVFAAASLQPALDAIAAAWAAKGGTPATLIYDPPRTGYGPPLPLRLRVAAAGAADAVITDETKELDALAKAGLIVPHTRRAIIGDDLVLVAPTDAVAALKIASGLDLAHALGEGRLALCAPASCAAGAAGRQSLERLKLWPAAQLKLLETPDARATLLAVGRGEARFGVVFAVEARADRTVKVLDTFPLSTYEPVTYAMALAKASRAPETAAFLAFLRSGQATRILTGLGFAVR